jgi:hypothetical protein
MSERLATALGFASGALSNATVVAMRARGAKPLAVEEAVRIGRFRFPHLGPEELTSLLRDVTELGEDALPAQRALLDRLSAQRVQPDTGRARESAP